jgi:DNA-binding MarR family transcriptional regulator
MASSAGWYLDLAAQALSAFNTQTQDSITQFMQRIQNLDGMDIAFIQVAAILEPNPLTPEVFITRTPYARPESFIENMLAAVGRGWLSQENGKFRLTEVGRDVAIEYFELSDQLFAKIQALPEPEMEHLLAFLNKVSAKIKTLPEPANKLGFELSLRFDRGPSAPLMLQLRRRIIDLLAFRDDVHIAAWKTHAAEGQLWEAFTLIWRDQAGNAAELAKQLAYRNYDETAYAAALDRLVACGWIAKLGSEYVVRPKAARMRQRVEKTTDRLYKAAFADLSIAEEAIFQQLLERFVEAVALPEPNQRERFGLTVDK